MAKREAVPVIDPHGNKFWRVVNDSGDFAFLSDAEFEAFKVHRAVRARAQQQPFDRNRVLEDSGVRPVDELKQLMMRPTTAMAMTDPAESEDETAPWTGLAYGNAQSVLAAWNQIQSLQDYGQMRDQYGNFVPDSQENQIYDQYTGIALQYPNTSTQVYASPSTADGYYPPQPTQSPYSEQADYSDDWYLRGTYDQTFMHDGGSPLVHQRNLFTMQNNGREGYIQQQNHHHHSQGQQRPQRPSPLLQHTPFQHPQPLNKHHQQQHCQRNGHQGVPVQLNHFQTALLDNAPQKSEWLLQQSWSPPQQHASPESSMQFYPSAEQHNQNSATPEDHVMSYNPGLTQPQPARPLPAEIRERLSGAGHSQGHLHGHNPSHGLAHEAEVNNAYLYPEESMSARSSTSSSTLRLSFTSEHRDTSKDINAPVSNKPLYQQSAIAPGYPRSSNEIRSKKSVPDKEGIAPARKRKPSKLEDGSKAMEVSAKRKKAMGKTSTSNSTSSAEDPCSPEYALKHFSPEQLAIVGPTELMDWFTPEQLHAKFASGLLREIFSDEQLKQMKMADMAEKRQQGFDIDADSVDKAALPALPPDSEVTWLHDNSWFDLGGGGGSEL